MRLRELEKMLNDKQKKIEELTSSVIKLESELDLSRHKIEQIEHCANERDIMHTEVVKEKQKIIEDIQKVNALLLSVILFEIVTNRK